MRERLICKQVNRTAETITNVGLFDVLTLALASCTYTLVLLHSPAGQKFRVVTSFFLKYNDGYR